MIDNKILQKLLCFL